MLLKCRKKTLDLSIPRVMGILNVTPDSFFDGGKYTGEAAVIEQAGKMLHEGADILDIGGMSTRPGAEITTVEEELKRVLPAIEAITKKFPDAILSIDTIHAKVAEEALKRGAHVVNDISGGTNEPEIIPVTAKYQAAFIIMHKKGNPKNMQQDPQYVDVVKEVKEFLAAQIEACHKAGLHDLVIDPGFGFGKNLEHNYELFRQLLSFRELQFPILTGISRKSMVCKPLRVNPEHALNGTTALHMIALMNGANILRVHDVKVAKEVITLYRLYQNPHQH